MSEPRVIGAKDSHDALRRTLSERAPCKVLDVPAGHGPIAQFLKDRGWEVHCCDIDAGNFALQGFPFQTADLNRALPHVDAQFDAVVCANALHRLFNPAAAVMEFFRVLRPGGTLYVNVNNYSSIRRRLRFLFYGSLDNAINAAHCEQTIAAPEANVRVPIMYPQMANLLESAGFRIVRAEAAGVRPMHRILAPLAWLIRGVMMVAPPRSRRRNRLAGANGAGMFPGGEYVFIEAVKPGA